MELARAQQVANAVVEKLKPYCSRIEVAGSIRRRRPQVRDIDLVLQVSDGWEFMKAVHALGLLHMAGTAIMRVQAGAYQIDIYLAQPEIWATLLLIRTGSTENNIRLASLARKRGWHLHADGQGLFDAKGLCVAGDTEASIYQALDLPFQEPWERG